MPIVEAMVALTLADALLVHIAQCESILIESSDEESGFIRNRLGKKIMRPNIVDS